MAQNKYLCALVLCLTTTLGAKDMHAGSGERQRGENAQRVYEQALHSAPASSQIEAAQSDEAVARIQAKKMGGLSGTPVNVGISGGGIVPKGMLLSAFNASYRHKYEVIEDHGNGARTLSHERYLLKLRYSPLDRLELIFVPGYIRNELDPFGRADEATIEGWTDFNLGATYMFLSQKFGDPLSASLSFGLNLPSGQDGPDRPAGGGAWGFNTKIGFTKVMQPSQRIDMDFGYAQSLEEGNQGVQKGYALSWNGSYHYVLSDYFDIGVEFAAEYSKEGEKYGRPMNNGYTDVFAGPAMNFIMPKWNMWLGAGLYLPIYRDVDAPTAYEDYRIEIKLGKLWSW